jgi:hypothetical protein
MSIWPAPGAILLAAAVPVTILVFLLGLASRIRPRAMNRRRVRCPLQGREATVDFVLRCDDGDAYNDVVACSLVEEHDEIACGKPCRSTGVAPFGTARMAWS